MRTQDFIAAAIDAEGHRRNEPENYQQSDAYIHAWHDAAEFVRKLDLGDFRPTED